MLVISCATEPGHPPHRQALPAWNMMLLAQRPLGILLPDIAQVDALVAVSRARVRLAP